MFRPLTTTDLLAVRRMLDAHVRHIEIARQLNLAVGTVSRIAADFALRRGERLEVLELPDDDPPPDYDPQNLRRCPSCGGMVYHWPCLACRLIAVPPVRS